MQHGPSVELAWDESGRRGTRYSPRAVRRLASSEDRVTDDSSDTLVSAARRKPFKIRHLMAGPPLPATDDYGEESEYSSSSSSSTCAGRSVSGWRGSLRPAPAPGSVFAVVSTAVVLLCSGALLYLYVNWSNDRLGQVAAATRPAAAVAGGAEAGSTSSVSAATSTALDNGTLLTTTAESPEPEAVPAAPQRPLRGVCLSRFCLAHSSYLEGYLDWAADPCADFYAFVCRRRRQSSDALLVAHAERALLEGFRGGRAPPLLDQCLKNPEPPAGVQRRLLRELLEDVGLGSWPFRNNRDHVDVFRVTATLARDLGLEALLSVELLHNPAAETLVAVGEPDLLIGQHRRLPRWYTDGVAAAFRIGGGVAEPNASIGVRDFSEKLAEISSSRGDEDFVASRFRITSVASYAAYKPLLSLVLRGLVTVRDQTRLLVKSDRYLRALRSVLQMTRASSALNYLGFRLVVHMSPLLGDEFRELWDLRLRQLGGTPSTSWPRWKRCLRHLEPLLQDVYMTAFARLLDAKLELSALAALASELKGRLVASLSSLPWMAAVDRPRARNVLAAVRVRFFYLRPSGPQHVHHRPMPGRLLTAYRDACRSTLSARLSAGGRWKGSVFDTWPRWDWASGSVFVPAALLDLGQLADEESLGVQVPRLASRLARSLLQAVHQRSHAFGRVEWSLNTTAGLHRLEACLDARISDVSSARRWLDNAALSPAQAQFAAYLRERRVPMGDSLRRGLTTRQLFHVLLATSLCAGPSEEARARVNQPLRNSVSFAALWNCTQEAPMNAERRCPIWSSSQ
ncbi:hypothetical protein V5799_019968 [Amblyomma americanum]|uniref:Peptidase M13 N-terminal domain-containing protein n=1 Tax=Amblyomma americanum TaxID=6943 RepID=A0AAQ4EV31_AMBAM